MEPAPYLPDRPADAAVKDALRIQAAAVAAQQAALGDEEAGLLERRAALEQQEAQLAAHLEEKRRRLVTLHEEARAARITLHNERAAFQESVEKTQQELTTRQKQVEQVEMQAKAERRRLIRLRRRLKKRWHQNLLAERRALAQQTSALQKQVADVQQHKAELIEERLRANGDIELGKRQLEEEWRRLRQEQETWKASCQREQTELQQRAAAIQATEAAVAQAQRDLAYDRHQWQGTRLLLEREAAGLDARIVNQRQKIVEQQNEIQRLENILSGLRSSEPAPSTDPTAPTPVPQAPEILPPRPERHFINCEDAANLQERLETLQRLAGELADQRWQLVEQWQRLAQTQQRWERDRDAAATDLETLSARLAEREHALLTAEERQEEAARELQRRHLDLIHQKHHLEAWQVRLRTREAAWEGERDRLMAELRGREQAAEQLQLASADLRHRWGQRRKQELDQLRAQRATVEKLRAEWVALREQWWRRTATLEEIARSLAEKELALERYRQQVLTAAPDAAAAERTVQALGRRLARQNAAAARLCQDAHRKLRAELEQLAARQATLLKQAGALLEQKATLAEQHAALEERETRARADEVHRQEQLRRLEARQERYELHILQLQDELERVAESLLQDSMEVAPTLRRAA